MEKISCKKSIFIISFLCLVMVAQAVQKVPINFNSYHGYTGTVKYLKKIAKNYPGFCQLITIGKSNLGRDIHVLVITNKKIGTTIDAHVKLRNMRKEGVKNVVPMSAHQGKPGHWICGAMHGNEFTGTEVCLYIIDKLVSGYGTKPEITSLINNKTFYICPVVNPDGVFNSVEKGISQRANSELKDNDNDGKVNEDGPDDLNKDGFFTYFRHKDSKGRFIVDDIDPRLMVRLKKGEKTKKQRYSVIREDRDNDGDGKRGEDSESGIDVNRNFPEVWFRKDGIQGGSGTYPTSSPEARAIAEFFTNHTNILMAQFYHTAGGFTFRPLGTSSHDKLHPKDVAVFDRIMGKKYLEIIGEKIPEAWEKSGSLAAFKQKLAKTSKNKYAIKRGYEMPRGWRVSYSESIDKQYSYGMATDWAYMQYGIYSITTELWNPAKDIGDFPKFEGKNQRIKIQRALLKYQDTQYQGKLFIPWKKYNHPQLGEGEIGGWISKYRNNAFPGDPLRNVCEKHYQFEIFRAGLLPEVAITDVKTRVLYRGDRGGRARVTQQGNKLIIKKGKQSKGTIKIVEVIAKLKNKGKLATHLARGVWLAGNRQDVVWLIGDRDHIKFLQGTPYQKIGILGGTLDIPGIRAKGTVMPPRGQARRRFGRQTAPKPMAIGPTREVKWLIEVTGNPTIKVVLTSQKGGTKIKHVTIK